MTITIPPGVQSAGAQSVWLVPSTVNLSAVTLANLAAVGTLKISCLLLQGIEPGVDVSRKDIIRLCLSQPIEALGNVKDKLGNIDYVVDPQNPTSETNKLHAMAGNGFTGGLIIRNGLPDATAPAVTQYYDAYPIQMPKNAIAKPADNEDFHATQEILVTGPVVRGALFAA